MHNQDNDVKSKNLSSCGGEILEQSAKEQPTVRFVVDGSNPSSAVEGGVITILAPVIYVWVAHLLTHLLPRRKLD